MNGLDGISEIAEQLRRSTVQIMNEKPRAQGFGSGVICGTDGTVVTNAHVASEARVHVQLWDGRSVTAPVVAQDPRSDLARIKLDFKGLPPKELPAVAWRDSTSVRLGELVVAVGNPLGFIGALSTGVVHASGAISGPISGLGSTRWIQASIRLAPGNSGGPLADAQGRSIGINTMMISTGIALAIPSDRVLRFLRRGILGVTVQLVALGAAALGLLVLEITPASPAENASLLMGDVLTSVNGRVFESPDDLSEAVEQNEASLLTLRFVRGDRRAEREVTIRMPASRREAA